MWAHSVIYTQCTSLQNNCLNTNHLLFTYNSVCMIHKIIHSNNWYIEQTFKINHSLSSIIPHSYTKKSCCYFCYFIFQSITTTTLFLLLSSIHCRTNSTAIINCQFYMYKIILPLSLILPPSRLVSTCLLLSFLSQDLESKTLVDEILLDLLSTTGPVECVSLAWSANTVCWIHRQSNFCMCVCVCTCCVSPQMERLM